MWMPQKLRQVLAERAKSSQYLAEIVAGTDNQQRLLNDKLTETIVVLTDLSNVLRSQLAAVVEGSRRQQKLLDEKMTVMIGVLNDTNNLLRSRLDGVVQGLDMNAQLLNSQSRMLDEKLDALIRSSHSQAS